MFRHYLISALRNMAANRLQSAIAIFGLAIGLAAAILAGVMIANQTSFDHFLPGHDRLYMVTVQATVGGRPTDYFAHTPHDVGERLKLNFPEINAVSRLKKNSHSLCNLEIEGREEVYDADPNIFDLLKLEAVHGDLGTALNRPDSIVIPVRIARKYFGSDDVVGRTLQLDRKHPLRITAVIGDLPDNSSNLETGIFISGRSSYSGSDSLSETDRRGRNSSRNFVVDVQTLVQLKQGAPLETLQRQIAAMHDRLLPHPASIAATLGLMRLDRLHLSPLFSPGVRQRLTMLGLVALLILFLSCVNFVNLSTARGAGRSVEVGVRKALGAGRGALIVQFIGESVLQALLALGIAVVITEWTLPMVNAFLNGGAVFNYWGDPVLISLLLLGAVFVGVLAGAYPAFLTAAFRPAHVLKGLMGHTAVAGLVRQSLVTLQFAILIALMIAAHVVFEQHRFAVDSSFRLNTDQVLFVRSPQFSGCDGSFKTEVASLRGVAGVACSDSGFIEESAFMLMRKPAGGNSTALYLVTASPDLLELYGQSVLAGRALRLTDQNIPVQGNIPFNIVINETAVRKLGFASPNAAIGKVLHTDLQQQTAVVVGVVRDFSIYALEKPINATVFATRNFGADIDLLHIKLKGRHIPETLAAIDSAWNRTGASGPIKRTFMNGYVENLRVIMLRQGQAFAIFAGIAMLLACLGLFGLSISAAERRTKKIGIRKAMGATSRDIVLLLLWQFIRPVLWATLIAWPLGWWLMRRWLSGYAYHVALGPLPFLTAAALAIMIALLTVTSHAILAARAVPATALRYE